MLLTLNPREYPFDADWWRQEGPTRFAENLGETLRTGAHAVRSTPRLLDLLSRQDALSKSQRGALREAAVRNQDPGQFAGVYDELTLVGPNADSNSAAGRALPWTWLADLRGALPRAALLAEDIDDARYYVWLARAYGASRVVKGIEVELTPRPGGGEGTPRVLDDLLRDPAAFVLTVVDSDKDHPAATPGSVARAVFKVVEAANLRQDDGSRLRAELLPARTIEHILPAALIEELPTLQSAHWLRPMLQRGFFARPDLEERLIYLPFRISKKVDGKVTHPPLTELALLDGTSGEVKAYRQRAAQHIRAREPGAGPDAELIYSVGKLMAPTVRWLDGHPDAARWLAAQLPDEATLLGRLAAVLWSWGLAHPPRIKAAAA